MAIFPLLPALGWISSTILGPVYVLYYGNDCAPLGSHIRHRKTVFYLCFPFSSQFSCHHSPPFSFEQIATFKASLLHFHFVLLAIPPFSPGKPKIKSKSLLRAHSDTKASLIGTFMGLPPISLYSYIHACVSRQRIMSDSRTEKSLSVDFTYSEQCVDFADLSEFFDRNICIERS